MEKENKLPKTPVTKKRKLSTEPGITSKEDLLNLYQSLKEKEENIDQEIASLTSEGATTELEPLMQALHAYNEMKDITQTVIGYLASAEQVTVKKLHERYNLPLD